MITVLVTGGRDYSDKDKVYSTLNSIHAWKPIIKLVEGGARGADHLASLWAQEYKIANETYDANWKKYGKSAGIIRNREMLINSKPDLVVAFPGGVGTADMVARAIKYGVPVRKV